MLSSEIRLKTRDIHMNEKRGNMNNEGGQGCFQVGGWCIIIFVKVALSPFGRRCWTIAFGKTLSFPAW